MTTNERGYSSYRLKISFIWLPGSCCFSVSPFKWHMPKNIIRKTFQGLGKFITIFVQPWSVMISSSMFTFQTQQFCPATLHFSPMKCWRLCREINRAPGATRTCFVHVLWNFSGFPCRGACFVHVLWNFMVCEMADIEICCAPNCSNSSMIWEREIDGEWTFNTSMNSRSPSCNFSDDRPL